jgi:large subunit ribosomal protein L6
MSKVGKKPIAIPDGVTVQFEGRILLVTGPKGKLEVPKLENVEVTQSGSEIVLQPASDSQQTTMNWGTMRSLLANAVDGVTKGYAKTLEIEGVGFKASMEGNDKLVLKVGFSHLVNFPVPQGITIAVEKNKIMVSGFDKHLVGQVAADIRKIKKPEPYLGKGIRYQGEVIRRKAGKKAGSAK